MQPVAATDSTASYSPADVELLAIEPARVDQIWSLARGHLALGLSWTRKMDLESLHARLLDGTAQLWMAYLPATSRILCSCVTEILLWESGYRTLRVLLVGGGRLELWKHLIRDIEAYARKEGAQAIEIVGRKGWERIFRGEGFTHTETVIGREID